MGEHNIPTPAVDDDPALASAGPEFTDPAAPVDGVDVAAMPAMRDVRRMLPADRLDIQAALGEIAAEVPAELADGDGDITEVLRGGRLRQVTGLFRRMQEIILDNAEDRDAMADWLIAQESGENAVVVAFERFASDLGNRQASTG